MKREITLKRALITASFLSLLAFAFVNIKTNANATHPFSKLELAQNKVESEDAAETRELPMPNVSVLGRLWDITQRLMDRAH